MVHEAFHTWDEAVVYHDRFFNGEIDYDTWCRLDVSLWQEHGIQEVGKLLDAIEPTPEALDVLSAVATHRLQNGSQVEMMILSSGFEEVARRVVAMAGLPKERIRIVANRLDMVDGRLVGKPVVALNDALRSKAAHLNRFLATRKIRPELALAIDDREEDRESFVHLGAFLHVEKPADLLRVLDYLK